MLPQDRALVVERLIELGKPQLAERFSRCMEFSYKSKCTHCGAERHTPLTCGLRGCDNPACGNHRYRYVRKYIGRLSACRHELKFITLTYGEIANADPDTFNNVFAAATSCLRFFHHRGAVMVAEVKRSAGCTLYLHIHILSAGNYIPQKLLSWKWKMLTGRQVVDIRQVGDKGRVAGYIMKYLRKVPELETAKDYADYINQFFKRRLVRSWGIFYKLRDIYCKEDVVCPYCTNVMMFIGVVPRDNLPYGFRPGAEIRENMRLWEKFVSATAA